MHFSTAAALISLASVAQAAPAIHGHKHAHARGEFGVGYHSSIFYTNWAMYGRKHFVTDLPADKLTKVNYAFANVNNVTGEVFLSDPWSDAQFPYPDDVPTNSSQLRGNFNQLYKLKQKNRSLKVVLSVGGWSWRGNFRPALSTEAGRIKFCSSSLELMKDLGLDGFDIDWEYPETDSDVANLIDTVQRCRKAYDEYSAQYANGYHFELGISAPAGPQRYTVFPISQIDPYVDNWNLMAFDYQGPGFSNFTGHLSNVYASESEPKSTNGWDSVNQKFEKFNTKQAIDYYKDNVESPSKIHLGMPLYGRSFANVADLSKNGRGLGQRFNGSGDGTFEKGNYDYKDLPRNGSKVYTNKEVIASWSWDAEKKEFITFDTPKVASWKVDFLKREGLGGAWWWESSGDRHINDDKSMVATVVKELGGSNNLHKSKNLLYYPQSKYYNIRSVVSNSTTMWGQGY
ncbi:glycoside hydrolase superfamily [Phaeosphaeriaceae sp. PMI808]|nr:glycoside hydrolase superfamily [Phaeosphaeriaceae sp. PMI808]